MLKTFRNVRFAIYKVTKVVITNYVINHLYKIINLHHVVQLQKRHKVAIPRGISFYTFLSLTTYNLVI